jgi:hypothetical protein
VQWIGVRLTPAIHGIKRVAVEFDANRFFIEQLPLQRADESLNIWILPRTSTGGANCLGTASIENCPPACV